MAIYAPLPSDSSIRVLCIDDTLNCQVSVVDLDDQDHAPYDCLSYTWGSPVPPDSPDAARYDPALATAQPAITVDGNELAVTQSLYEALCQLRQGDPARLRSIWIDAICIDQRNPEGLAERASQVAMMDRIYASATHVFVWLGPAPENEAASLTFAMQQLASVSTNTLEMALLSGPLHVLDLATYEKLAIEPMSIDVLKLIGDFFQRAWFQRMWTHQEAALARSLSFHLGPKMLTWRDLERSTMLIYRLGLLLSDVFSSPPGIIESIEQPEVCLRVSESTCLAWNCIRSILKFREESKVLGVENRFAHLDLRSQAPVTATREYAGNPQAWKGFRTHVLHKSRRKKASDPRDKIYAMLGLLQGMTDETGNKVITPDYSQSNSATKLYTQITRELFQDDTSLVWGAAIRVPPVEDWSVRNISDLPSWVPDFSAPDTPMHIMSAAMFHYNASAHLVGGFIPTRDSYQWGVRGLHVNNDRIIALGESYEEMKMTCSVQRCIQLIKRTSYLARGGLERGDILARTLTANLTLGFETPTEDRKAVFRCYLAALKASQLIKSNKTTKGDDALAMHAVDEFVLLVGGWRPTYDMVTVVERTILGAELSLTEKEEARAVLNQASRYEAQLNRLFTNRRLFLTQMGRVGIGPTSLQVGDEVWLIPPEKTFHILRPVAGQQYRLMGDAYVDGIMFGEAAMSAKEEDLVDVYLV
ncbi:hypothetical protein EJ04DRAFT_521688 [Polyplosphaeria fusca]|uniref:Heterokaryon incompatibility domain-containing protein n=1 Tax=Polyplosphaeria fusca TaxID=682080 RepID=A0A9P4R4N0_9PLEO|nr:hypothetical protein EJ04DRAFT_521688 [Polyplosphaeria fusca]